MSRPWLITPMYVVCARRILWSAYDAQKMSTWVWVSWASFSTRKSLVAIDGSGLLLSRCAVKNPLWADGSGRDNALWTFSRSWPVTSDRLSMFFFPQDGEKPVPFYLEDFSTTRLKNWFLLPFWEVLTAGTPVFMLFIMIVSIRFNPFSFQMIALIRILYLFDNFTLI